LKFCYFDESGMGSEPYLVVAAIVVDGQRMHITKVIWADFLDYLSTEIGRPVTEFHTRLFYSGNGIWRGLDGLQRAAIINAIIRWLRNRKHKVVFSCINKSVFDSLARQNDPRIHFFNSKWCAAVTHCILQIQKQHQGLDNNKGHSVLIFDREVSEENSISQFVFNPPSWIDSYYGRKKKQLPLDQIIDVPFFADSVHLLLAQVTDLIVYILRTSAEIQDNLLSERFTGEGDRMQAWSEEIASLAYPPSNRYPKKNRCEVADFFWELTPPVIRNL
jgi:hypothetical protein